MGNSRRFKRAMKANLSRKYRDGGGYGGIKMSEVLMDFAEPMVRGLSLPEDRDAFVVTLKITALLWNEAVSPGPGGSEALYASLSDAIGGPRAPDMEKLFDAMIARGRLLYPDLDQFITSVHVSVGGGGECTVRVISTV
jgi:hypothetical protein